MSLSYYCAGMKRDVEQFINVMNAKGARGLMNIEPL
jgi:hypothetical protein